MAVKCPKKTTRTVVTCGKSTAPPHTDEKNPGKCSRTKIFCVAAGNPKPEWACFQHGGKRYETETTQREFKDCKDAVETFKREADAGVAAADTRAYFKYSAQYSFKQQASGKWTTSTRVRWSVDPDKTIVRLLDISWPNMTAADRAAVQEAADALKAHEEGHVDIAEDYAEELSGASLSATKATQLEAKATLDEKVKDHVQEAQDELHRLQEEYDDTTEHGRKQSNIGGKDVVLKCP